MAPNKTNFIHPIFNNMDMTEMTLAERREKMRKENAKRFAGLSAYMAQCRKEALEF